MVRNRYKYLKSICLAVCTLALAFRLGLFVKWFGVNVFFSDQWDFLSSLFHPTSFWQQFNYQHGPHRMGLGLPLMVLLLKQTSWNANSVSYAMVGVFVLSSVVALILKKRLIGKLNWGDLIIPFLFLNSSQWESLLVTPNLSHGPLSALFVLLFSLSLTFRNKYFRVVGLVIFSFLATFSGFGLFLGAIAPIYFFFQFVRCNERDKFLNFSGLLGAVSVVFLFARGYLFAPTSSCFIFPDAHPQNYPIFIFYSYARALGATRIWSLPTALGIILCVFVYSLAVRLAFQLLTKKREFSSLEWVLFTLSSYSILFSTNLAVGRVCSGVMNGFVTRYMPYTVLGIYGVYVFLCSLKREGLRVFEYSLVLLFLSFDLWPRSIDIKALHYYHDRKANWVQCYLNEKDVKVCGAQVGFDVYPQLSSSAFLEKLKYLEERRLGFFSETQSSSNTR